MRSKAILHHTQNKKISNIWWDTQCLHLFVTLGFLLIIHQTKPNAKINKCAKHCLAFWFTCFAETLDSDGYAKSRYRCHILHLCLWSFATFIGIAKRTLDMLPSFRMKNEQKLNNYVVWSNFIFPVTAGNLLIIDSKCISEEEPNLYNYLVSENFHWKVQPNRIKNLSSYQ